MSGKSPVDSRHDAASPSARDRPVVVVAGSGVGAVEAVLALRALSGEVADIELVADDLELDYWPLAVVEPFGPPETSRMPLSRLEETHGVRVRRDGIARLDRRGHRVTLLSGEELTFDALVLATGVRAKRWLPGPLTFGGHSDVAAYRALLAELEAGTADRVVFAVPALPSWTLPLYELALLTAAWLAERGVIGARLAIATPSSEPLALFGPSAASLVRNLLGDRGIELLTNAQVHAVGENRTALIDDAPIEADRVVTLPTLVGQAPAGFPTNRDGFVSTGEHGEVAGLGDVYAVGDVTDFPVKQASLAAQQADAAAAAIAARLGRAVEPEPFVPVVHAILLTGVTAAYLRADVSGRSDAGSSASFSPLWWPPEKLAGRFLAPYLVEQHGRSRLPETADREEQRRVALRLAHDDAERGDYDSARAWLDVLERLDGVLRQDRVQWRER